MKRSLIIAIALVAVSLLSFSAPAAAQREATPIEFGMTVEGALTNRDWDVLYSFNGAANEIVVINLIADDSASFDPYLYLTTPDNEIIAQNDDYFSLNARIIARLPETGDYDIVATRLGERTASGDGPFTLSLDKVRAATAGTVLEGSAVNGGEPPTHVFFPEQPGVYTIRYTHIRGQYFPGLMISKITEDSSYEEDVAQISGRGMRAGELTLEFEPDAIYVLSVEQNYYDYSAETDAATIYTITIDAPEDDA